MEKRKEQKLYCVPNYGKPVQVSVRYREYVNNSTLAVALYAKSEDFFDIDDDDILPEFESDDFDELYAVLTVNLPESSMLDPDTQFIDNNNHPWAYKWLIDNDLAEPTGLIGRSWFCNYPAMKFHLEL